MHDHTVTTPPRARTDARTDARSGSPTEARVDAAAPSLDDRRETGRARTVSTSTRSVRRLGVVLTVGAGLWAGSIFAFGTNATGLGGRIGDVAGFAFQLGVFALLTVMVRTRATGVSRLARILLRVEFVLLGLASLWSLLHGLGSDAVRESGLVMALDAFWPLSMLGMFVIGIKLAVAGRWQGALRVWPLVAETWAVVSVPTFLVFGEPVSNWVGGTHLLVGYATLGILLARRPELSGASD